MVGKKRQHMEVVPPILFFVSGLCHADEHFPWKTPCLTCTVVIRIVAGTVHFFYFIAVSTSFYSNQISAFCISYWKGRRESIG